MGLRSESSKAQSLKKKKKNLKKNSGNEWNNLCHLYQFEFSMATSGADTETVVDIACQ